MDSALILPALAVFSVSALVIVKIYYIIRTKFPAKVNCWFCNSHTSVPYNSSNSWYCPHCDQYNGFSLDGGYNRVLPEQFNEKLNNGSWCTRAKSKSGAPNGLCQFCNINLELKVQQLAQFVPLNQDNFDDEIQQYSDKLERVYRLCPKCEKVLANTLSSKQEMYITRQHHTFKTAPAGVLQLKGKERHFVYLNLTAALSLGLLLSVLPHSWLSGLLDTYPLPEWLCVSRETLLAVLLGLGVLVQLCDCAHMRDSTSLVNLLLWLVLLYLTRVASHIEGLVSVVHMLAAVVFFITSITERQWEKPNSVADVKPVQLQKLDKKYEPVQRDTDTADSQPVSKPTSMKSTVSDPYPKHATVSDPYPKHATVPDPYPKHATVSDPYPKHASSSSHNPTPEDFGLSKLSVSSRRVTRSQTKPFQTKTYGLQSSPELFKPKSFNLTPPKLQLEKCSEYQAPLTRSSSQSSGFVSLSHEYRPASVVDDNLDSVSQCGGAALTPYQPPFINTSGFSSPYGMPFSQFQPYTIMHLAPQHFNKFYPYPDMSPYVPSLNLSTMSNQREDRGWFQCLKSVFSSLMFLFLITSNVAVCWKVFGEDYFKNKT